MTEDPSTSKNSSSMEYKVSVFQNSTPIKSEIITFHSSKENKKEEIKEPNNSSKTTALSIIKENMNHNKAAFRKKDKNPSQKKKNAAKITILPSKKSKAKVRSIRQF